MAFCAPLAGGGSRSSTCRAFGNGPACSLGAPLIGLQDALGLTRNDRLSRWLPLGVVVLLAVAVSAGSIGHGFAYDDGPIIFKNTRVHDLARWGRLFTSSYWPPRFGGSLYRPFTTFLFALQWAAAG